MVSVLMRIISRWIQLAVEAQTLHHRQQVDRLALLEELAYGAENRLMLRGVEILHMQGLDGVDKRRLVEHEGPEHALLQGHSLRGSVAVESERLLVCHSVIASCVSYRHFYNSIFGLQNYTKKLTYVKKISTMRPLSVSSPTVNRLFTDCSTV